MLGQIWLTQLKLENCYMSVCYSQMEVSHLKSSRKLEMGLCSDTVNAPALRRPPRWPLRRSMEPQDVNDQWLKDCICG